MESLEPSLFGPHQELLLEPQQETSPCFQDPIEGTALQGGRYVGISNNLVCNNSLVISFQFKLLVKLILSVLLLEINIFSVPALSP